MKFVISPAGRYAAKLASASPTCSNKSVKANTCVTVHGIAALLVHAGPLRGRQTTSVAIGKIGLISRRSPTSVYKGVASGVAIGEIAVINIRDENTVEFWKDDRSVDLFRLGVRNVSPHKGARNRWRLRMRPTNAACSRVGTKGGRGFGMRRCVKGCSSL